VPPISYYESKKFLKFIRNQNAAKKFQKLYAKAGNYKIEPNCTEFSFNIVKYHKILLNA
jgi:hypothetical protein